MKKIFIAFTLCLLMSQYAIAQDISDRIRQVRGVDTLTEVASNHPDYRVFEIQFLQEEDHFSANSPTFRQKLILWHKNEDRPMVLQTSGYAIFGNALAALATEFNANQIQVEHRFFANSTPASQNWTLDNIKQSAADFHKITENFKSIYTAKWVNTGRSKGGMTSLYHRYFYPDDLAATVAHVAPHSYSLEDQRYADFIGNKIGGPENEFCRANLVSSQKVLLNNKAAILSRMTGDFSLLGTEDPPHGKEIALEHAIIELPWAYWQYSGPGATCANVPIPTAPVDQHMSFLFSTNDPNGYSNAELEGFVPYYFQAATQLGNPGTKLDPIANLLNFADTFSIHRYIPRNIATPYDNGDAMREVANWLRTQSTRMLFVYGGWDPWTGGAHPEEDLNADKDNYRFVVDKMNHSAQFIDLKGEAHALAYQKLRNWLNISDETPVNALAAAAGFRDAKKEAVNIARTKSLEYLEFKQLKKHAP